MARYMYKLTIVYRCEKACCKFSTIINSDQKIFGVLDVLRLILVHFGGHLSIMARYMYKLTIVYRCEKGCCKFSTIVNSDQHIIEISHRF